MTVKQSSRIQVRRVAYGVRKIPRTLTFERHTLPDRYTVHMDQQVEHMLIERVADTASVIMDDGSIEEVRRGQWLIRMCTARRVGKVLLVRGTPEDAYVDSLEYVW